MFNETAVKPKRRKENWFLWWVISPEELGRQVVGYHTLSFRKSARGISVICLAISLLITVLMVAFRLTPIGGLVDVLIMAVLAAFIYFGHRWAMIAAMVLWTLEKGMALFGGFAGATPHAGGLILQVAWWCIYMHAFYLAFQVERARRKLTDENMRPPLAMS